MNIPKAISEYTFEELEQLERHQRFILSCDSRTHVLLLIHQLERHMHPDMDLSPVCLGGNLLLTHDLADAFVSALRKLLKADVLPTTQVSQNLLHVNNGPEIDPENPWHHAAPGSLELPKEGLGVLCRYRNSQGESFIGPGWWYASGWDLRAVAQGYKPEAWRFIK